MNIQIKRIYEAQSDNDGFRVLIDRLWPRGIKKEKAGIDFWEKNIAPSTELRKWYGHDPEKFEEFKTRYKEELNANPETEEFLKTIEAHNTMTFLFSAKDAEHSNAAVLEEWVEENIKTDFVKKQERSI